MLRKISAYRTKDNELLEKYNKIWDKVRKVITFDSEPVYNEKYIK